MCFYAQYFDEMPAWSLIFYIRIKQYYMQTFRRCLHFCQVEELKNMRNEQIKCYQIASGDWESMYLATYGFDILCHDIWRLLILADMEWIFLVVELKLLCSTLGKKSTAKNVICKSLLFSCFVVILYFFQNMLQWIQDLN